MEVIVLIDVIFFTIAPLRLAVGISDTFTTGVGLTIILDTTTGTEMDCALLLPVSGRPASTTPSGVGEDDCFTTTADLSDGVDLTTSVVDVGIFTVDTLDGDFDWKKLLKLLIPLDDGEVVVVVVVVVEGAAVGLILSILDALILLIGKMTGLTSSILGLDTVTGEDFTSDLLAIDVGAAFMESTLGDDDWVLTTVETTTVSV